jgi:hypothetical protein
MLTHTPIQLYVIHLFEEAHKPIVKVSTQNYVPGAKDISVVLLMGACRT